MWDPKTKFCLKNAGLEYNKGVHNQQKLLILFYASFRIIIHISEKWGKKQAGVQKITLVSVFCKYLYLISLLLLCRLLLS